jgi:hypothetical protein
LKANETNLIDIYFYEILRDRVDKLIRRRNSSNYAATNREIDWFDIESIVESSSYAAQGWYFWWIFYVFSDQGSGCKQECMK